MPSEPPSSSQRGHQDADTTAPLLRPPLPMAKRINRNVLIVAAVLMGTTVITALVALNPSHNATVDPKHDAPTTDATDPPMPSSPSFLEQPTQPKADTDTSTVQENQPALPETDQHASHLPSPTVHGMSNAKHQSVDPHRSDDNTPSLPNPYTLSYAPSYAPLPISDTPTETPTMPQRSPREEAYTRALVSRSATSLLSDHADHHVNAGGSDASLSAVPLSPTDNGLSNVGESSVTGSMVPPSSGTSLPTASLRILSSTSSYNAFMSSARATASSGQSNAVRSSVEPVRSPYLLQAGTVLPGILITGIHSDLPGQLLAQVSRNVYDSRTQRVLLIPQGAKLIATYDNAVMAGQNRVLVAFTRLIFPDGRSIALPGLGITDPQGQAGIADRVDNHYRRLFGNAILLSLIGAGAQLSQPRQSGTYTTPSAGQVAAGAVGQELADVATETTRRNLDIQPTITIRPGTLFNVFLNGDLTFGGPYVDER